MDDPKKYSKNNVQAIREALLLSKAELARRAGVSPLTIDRIEAGKDCRVDTKRKIILALGLKLSEKDKVFVEGGVDDNSRQAREAVQIALKNQRGT
ncbi:MAG: hypothetical protein GMKNLPBB_01911 [Myxococcota bacterium]|nr:hypothetical protein [Myxococcota bacterium]